MGEAAKFLLSVQLHIKPVATGLSINGFGSSNRVCALLSTQNLRTFKDFLRTKTYILRSSFRAFPRQAENNFLNKSVSENLLPQELISS